MTAIPLHVLGLAMVVAFSAFLAKVLFPTRSGEIAPHFNGGVSGFLAQYTCTGCNPIGQIVFIMLFGGSFVVAYVTIFPLLHQNGMSELYRSVCNYYACIF